MNFAVIDTETTYDNDVMSLGIVISNFNDFSIIDKEYYIVSPEYKKTGIFSFALRHSRGILINYVSRSEMIDKINYLLKKNNVNSIFAYNACFDSNHLPELVDYDWYDILRIAAYKQYNKKIPPCAECCKSGRLKTHYGVEHMYTLLSGNDYYEEHNAICDAIDELEIMKMLNLDFEVYKKALI